MLPSEGTLLELHAQPDMRILLFGVGVALATGLLFGLAPALQATKLDVSTTLKDAAGGLSAGRSSTRLRKVLVTVQVALSFLLLAGAGLFAKTLINLKNTDTGLRNIGNMVTFQVDPRGVRYTVPQIRSFYENVLREIQATPGVTSTAFSVVPLLHGYEWSGAYAVEGYQPKDGEDVVAIRNFISPDYYRTMGIQLLAGRDFKDNDRFDGGNLDRSPAIAIVNRKFAEDFFGKQSPIGRHIGRTGPDSKLDVEIIGEVENSLYRSPREGMRRQVYYPLYQTPVSLPAVFYVRSAAASSTLFPILRGIVAKLDPTLPVFEMKTLEMQLDETLNTERLIASLSVVFG